MITSLLGALSLPPVLLAIAAAAPPLSAPHDALTGVWQGSGKGDNSMLPPEGFTFSMVLEQKGEDEALVTLTMQGLPATQPAEASFDGESGEVEFRCDLFGILVEVALV